MVYLQHEQWQDNRDTGMSSPKITIHIPLGYAAAAVAFLEECRDKKMFDNEDPVWFNKLGAARDSLQNLCINNNFRINDASINGSVQWTSPWEEAYALLLVLLTQPQNSKKIGVDLTPLSTNLSSAILEISSEFDLKTELKKNFPSFLADFKHQQWKCIDPLQGTGICLQNPEDNNVKTIS